MKAKDVIKLKKGDKVNHLQLGVCTVVRADITAWGELFGLVLYPDTQEGIGMVRAWSGGRLIPIIETSYRLIKSL